MVCSILVLLPNCQKATSENSTSSGCDSSVAVTDNSDDPLYSAQWHLSSGVSGVTDLNIGSIWDISRGDGVRVNVVDDGMDITHEDLSPNVASGAGLNFWAGQSGFSTSTTDPSGSYADHGTAVSGLIGARDKNGTGVRGVAPRACLAGVNLIANGGATSTQEGTAMAHNSSVTAASNNSWGPTDKLGTLANSSSTWRSSITTGVTSGNGGKGTVYFWAAGNGARSDLLGSTGYETDNANYDGYANYYGVIAVCGVLDNGTRVYYSEKGANLWVCGFSQTTTYNTNARGLTTTDQTGTNGFNARSATTSSDTSLTSFSGSYLDYTNGSYTRIMNGTSGATPEVLGVAALMLKANPNLTWRDVKLILAETARQNDSSESHWTTNGGTKISGGGHYHINDRYGFGVVDATAAVQLASTWTNVAAESTAYDSGTVTVNSAFSNNNSTGASHSIVVSGSAITKVEYVEVTLTSTGDIGDLQVELTNTAGTSSILAEPHNCFATTSSTTPLSTCGQTFSAWRFGSARHLGESANQTWTLKVSDQKASTASSGGTFTSWRLKIYGRAS